LECRDLFFNLFFFQNEFILAPVCSFSFIRKCLAILQRISSVMLALGPNLTNQNLFVLDSKIKLELLLKEIQSRTLSSTEIAGIYDPSLPAPAASNKSLSKSSGDKIKFPTQKSPRQRAWNPFLKVSLPVNCYQQRSLTFFYLKGEKEKPPPLEDNLNVFATKKNRTSVRNRNYEEAKFHYSKRIWSFLRQMKANFRKLKNGLPSPHFAFHSSKPQQAFCSNSR